MSEDILDVLDELRTDFHSPDPLPFRRDLIGRAISEIERLRTYYDYYDSLSGTALELHREVTELRSLLKDCLDDPWCRWCDPDGERRFGEPHRDGCRLTEALKAHDGAEGSRAGKALKERP